MRTRVDPHVSTSEKPTNLSAHFPLIVDPRISDEDHVVMQNVLSVLKNRFITMSVYNTPQFDDDGYRVQFIGVQSAVPYKALSEIHLLSPRLIKNVRISAIEQCDTQSQPCAKILLEVMFGYHKTSQLTLRSESMLSDNSSTNWLLGYKYGAREHVSIQMPDDFQHLPIDDQVRLQQIVFLVHHMRDGLPMIYMQLDKFSYEPYRDASLAASSSSSSNLPKMDVREYNLSFFNLDHVDSDFINYLTVLLGTHISKVIVAPYMFELKLPSTGFVELEGDGDDGNDGDTEDEEDEKEKDEVDKHTRASVKKRKTSNHSAPQIATVRLMFRVQGSTSRIQQTYGLPDESATLSLVRKAAPTSAVAIGNLDVSRMWAHLGKRGVGIALHTETDVETDGECDHRSKRKVGQLDLR